MSRVRCLRGHLGFSSSPQGGCVGPLDAWHGGRMVTSTGGTASCPQQCLPSHGMWIQCWFPSHCLWEQFPLQIQPLQNPTAWQERGLGHHTALPQLCFQIPWSGDTGEEQGPAPGPCIFCQSTESPSPGNKPSHSREINAGMACSQVG